MGKLSYRLRITGSFSEKGFGFSCMQMAFKYNITGTLFYESRNLVLLELNGPEVDILQFISQCKKNNFIDDIRVLDKSRTDSKVNDFIMLNQI